MSAGATEKAGVSFIAGLIVAGAPFAADSGFTPAQLTALPTTNWITNGGNVYNRRYSPLKQLERTNVKELKAVWRTQSNVPGDGWSSITMAPLYYEGMVIIGHSGGERGIRGVVKAFDARTGKERWHWYTIPAPGLLYLAVANPSPDLNGHVREGDNLYSSSR